MPYKLDSEHMKEKLKELGREINLEEQFNTFYKGNQGISFTKGAWIESLSFDIMKYANKETAEDFFIFCDMMEPIFNQDKKIEYIQIRIDKEIVTMPTQPITKIWNAGYPRAGLLMESYILTPWERIKPLKMFLDGKISIEDVIHYYISNQNRFYRVIYDHTYSNFIQILNNVKSNEGSLQSLIKASYERFYQEEINRIDEALVQSMKLPMFHSIIIGDHDVFKDFDNPFVRYILINKGHFTLRNG